MKRKQQRESNRSRKHTNQYEQRLTSAVLDKPATFNREIWAKQPVKKDIQPTKAGFNKAAWKHDGNA